jgi:hypothetical protein
MKNKILYAVSIALFSQITSAHDTNSRQNVPYNFFAEPFSAMEHFDEQAGCGGYARAGYIRSKLGSPKTLAASAVGGEFSCFFALNSNAKIHLAFFGSLDTGLNHDDDNRIHGDFFDADKDSYLLFGEAHLSLSYNSFEAHLGRQQLDTPHMGSDDLRIVPNLFEAYMVEFHLTDNLHAGVGFVRTMAGWENGADQAHFESVGDAFGGDGDKSWLGWLTHESALFDSNLWYYHVADNVKIVYADIIHTGLFSNGVEYSLGLQGDWGEDIGKSNMGAVEARTWGATTTLTYRKLSAALAYNKNNSNKGALPSLGGGPFFTSMEDQTLDAISGKKAEAILVALEYAATSNFTVGTALGQFNASDKSIYDVEELDIYLTYSWKEHTSIELTYAQVNNKNLSGKDEQLRLIASYNY